MSGADGSPRRAENLCVSRGSPKGTWRGCRFIHHFISEPSQIISELNNPHAAVTVSSFSPSLFLQYTSAVTHHNNLYFYQDHTSVCTCFCTLSAILSLSSLLLYSVWKQQSGKHSPSFSGGFRRQSLIHCGQWLETLSVASLRKLF